MHLSSPYLLTVILVSLRIPLSFSRSLCMSVCLFSCTSNCPVYNSSLSSVVCSYILVARLFDNGSLKPECYRAVHNMSVYVILSPPSLSLPVSSVLSLSSQSLSSDISLQGHHPLRACFTSLANICLRCSLDLCSFTYRVRSTGRLVHVTSESVMC